MCFKMSLFTGATFATALLCHLGVISTSSHIPEPKNPPSSSPRGPHTPRAGTNPNASVFEVSFSGSAIPLICPFSSVVRVVGILSGFVGWFLAFFVPGLIPEHHPLRVCFRLSFYLLLLVHSKRSCAGCRAAGASASTRRAKTKKKAFPCPRPRRTAWGRSLCGASKTYQAGARAEKPQRRRPITLLRFRRYSEERQQCRNGR